VSRIPADKTLVSTDKSYNFVGILQKKKNVLKKPVYPWPVQQLSDSS
jgi:hypothetical protein